MKTSHWCACRNRLENNTEHWNALLLSLRELIEWVIRKDTELTGLGPIRGDLSTLVKQQVSRTLFLTRRSTTPPKSFPFDIFFFFSYPLSLSLFYCTLNDTPFVRLQDDFRAFRRQLDDKRPLIEQSILTGRQLVANEAPLSDASDSEGNSSFQLPRVTSSCLRDLWFIF